MSSTTLAGRLTSRRWAYAFTVSLATPLCIMYPEGNLGPWNAIWDDGEWVSWAEINQHIVDQLGPDAEERDWVPNGIDYSEVRPTTREEKLARLESMVLGAQELVRLGRKDEIDFGEMGEMYAEIRYGIVRHQRKNAEGSDGRLGNDFVEVKTITPWKTKHCTQVRRSGHFSKLVVVKVDEHFMFDARIVDRASLSKGHGGKHARVSWSSLPGLGQQASKPRS